MIIFEEFGGGQTERERNIAAFSGHSTGTATLLTLPVPTKEKTKEVIPSQTGERLSRSSVAAPSAASTRGGISVSLHGTRFAEHGPRLPLSNRELGLLERRLSYCKQRLATVSNRELWTVHNFTALTRLMRDRTVALRYSSRIAGSGSRPPAAFLPGSAQYVECDVTPTKQTTATFLPGATTACVVGRTSERRRPKYFAQISSKIACGRCIGRGCGHSPRRDTMSTQITTRLFPQRSER